MRSHIRSVLTITLLFVVFGGVVLVAVVNFQRAEDWRRFEHSHVTELRQQESDNSKLRTTVSSLRARLDPLEDQRAVDRESASTATYIADALSQCLSADQLAESATCHSLPDLLRRYADFLSHQPER